MTLRKYVSLRAGASRGRLSALRRRQCAAMVSVAMAVATYGLPALAQTGGYPDVDEGNVHARSIDALVTDSRNILAGTGCGEGRFCPDDPLPRWVMAVWLVRALDGKDPAPSGVSDFTDVDPDRWWATYTNRLGQLGVTHGCSADPPRYCPDQPVTRAEMATFLARAFALDAGTPGRFSDTSGNFHADNIDRLAEATITAGCAQDRYCPDRSVTRAEMATFLARALKLVELPGAPQAGSYRLYYEHRDYHSDFGGQEMWIATLQGLTRKLDSISIANDAIFSRDGSLVAYTKWSGYEQKGVYVLNLNSGAVREIARLPTHGANFSVVAELALSPDGKFLTYSYRAQSDKEVWIGEANGQNWRKLSNVTRAPTFSPDSQFITYPVMVAGTDNYSHSIIENLSTGSQTRFDGDGTYRSNVGFTPDSQRVFYPSNFRETKDTYDSRRIWDYVTIDTDGTDRQTLASGVTSALYWSPDGTKFTYRGYEIIDARISDDDGETWQDVKLSTLGDYRVASANGSFLGEFPRSGGCDSVSWVRDSRHVVYGFRNHNLVADTNDRTYTREEKDGFWSRKQRGLSPDWQRIAYYRESPLSGLQLWVMDADGSNSRKLADRVANYEWSPDGQYIAYGIYRCTDPSCNTVAGGELWIAERDGSSPLKVVGADDVFPYYSLRWITS